MIAPVLPINIINELIKKASIMNQDKKYFQLKWNKFSNTYETRWFFSNSYKKQFGDLKYRLEYKLRNPPEFCGFLVEPCIENAYKKDWTLEEPNLEELDTFVKKLRWGMKFEFPVTSIYHYNETYSYIYYHFENGKGGYDCAFIEENSCENPFHDDTPFFHRAYVSLNGVIYPFFKEPLASKIYYPWNTETTQLYDASSCFYYYSIPYLNKERGMIVKLDGHLNYSFNYFNEEENDWNYEQFTPYERNILISDYEKSDDGY